ncbi:hypothetical protein EIK77_000050, partial [Talaromyces pinophilus]
DLNFTGGVVHIIDKVLTVPLNVSSSAAAAGLSAVAGALQAEKLTETVDDLKNVTIFAPENSAFQAIGSALGNFTADQLTGILEYHVLNDTLAYSTDLKNDTQYTAVNVANGVVHIIDNVLNPNNTSATPNATATSQIPAFSGASSASAIPFTSGVTASATATGTGAGAGAGVTGTSSSTAGAMPMRTAGVGAAMVFGAAALLNANVF